MPLQIWSTFGVERRFGFNRSTPFRFAKDKLLGVVLLLLFGTPLLAAVIWLMQQAGASWWLWAWVVWMGFALLASWVFPTWIAPLFNRFEPLAEGPLKQRLEGLLARCGFHSNGMYVMDGSSRSSHGNAYFTGFGRNKRIVFYDTLLDGMEDAQVEAVLAHELGHFKRHHVIKMLLINAVLSLCGLALLAWLAEQAWFYRDLGVTQQDPASALALFILVLPVFAVWISPLLSMLSRRHEFEADAFAAQQASAQALIDGLLGLYRDNASSLTPDRLYSAFHHSHPPAAERIRHLSHLISDGDRLAAEAP
jgi:STE24 endopeptidase